MMSDPKLATSCERASVPFFEFGRRAIVLQLDPDDLKSQFPLGDPSPVFSTLSFRPPAYGRSRWWSGEAVEGEVILKLDQLQ